MKEVSATVYKYEVGDLVKGQSFARSKRGVSARYGYEQDNIICDSVVISVDEVTKDVWLETIESYDDFKTVSNIGRRKDSHIPICRKLKKRVGLVWKIEELG